MNWVYHILSHHSICSGLLSVFPIMPDGGSLMLARSTNSRRCNLQQLNGRASDRSVVVCW
jgi:hypothetical protein